MTNMPENELQTQPAKTGSIYELLGVGPLPLATATIHHWLKPLDENIAIEGLALALESTLMSSNITSYDDPTLMACTQMRVLDTIFNRFILQAVEYGQYPRTDLQKITLALKAQRQCMQSLGELNRNRRLSKNNEQTKGR